MGTGLRNTKGAPAERPTLARILARPGPELCEVPDCFDDEEITTRPDGSVAHTGRCMSHRPARQRPLFQKET